MDTSANHQRIFVRPSRGNPFVHAMPTGCGVFRALRSRILLCSLLIGIGLLNGCSPSKTKQEVWTAKPQVIWADLCNTNVQWHHNSYTLLTNGPTKGLFPAEIAVTRVAREQDENNPAITRRRLLRDPQNEFLQWNKTLDDQMAISAVFPIAERDLGGAEPGPDHINAAMRALQADLGLIYAFNEISESKSEMFGALYDTSLGWPVAVIHASAETVNPPEGDDPENQEAHEELTAWETDSRALTRHKFDRLVYACVRELIMRDQPADVSAPEGWVPVGPIMPVQWPPAN